VGEEERPEEARVQNLGAAGEDVAFMMGERR